MAPFFRARWRLVLERRESFMGEGFEGFWMMSGRCWNGVRMVFEELSDGWQKDDMMPILGDWACNWTCKLDLQNRGLRHTRALKWVNTLFVVFFDGNLPLRSKSFV